MKNNVKKKVAQLGWRFFRKSKIYISASMVADKSNYPFWEATDKVLDSDASRCFFSYPRYKTLELIADEIRQRGLKGNVAELGVYKGNFSWAINTLFSDRILYLFDTFDGFDLEQELQDCKGGLYVKENGNGRRFSDTDEFAVLSRMSNSNLCKIVKGLFPNSLDGLEDTFCLVSLDADLYQPTIDGLNYFYPRLEKGGYILLHDYNNPEFLGVKQAVLDYEKEHGLLARIPITDSYGSLVISKI